MPDTQKYSYSAHEWAEIEHMARGAIPGRVTLDRATLQEDFDGIDVHYTIDHQCDLQIRVRRNRPAYAADRDVTFRTTELRPIERGTYAPLMLFIWLNEGFAVAGKLVDIYRMASGLQPQLRDRFPHRNHDGTRWVAVEISELVATGSLLRQGDRSARVAAALGGNEQTLRIVQNHRKAIA